jgi:hypothetical protein
VVSREAAANGGQDVDGELDHDGRRIAESATSRGSGWFPSHVFVSGIPSSLADDPP